MKASRPKARTTAACLASAVQEMRETMFVVRRDDGQTVEVSKSELNHIARQMLIARVRRAEVAENAGAIGIIAAVFGLLWMLRQCGPALFPALFQ